MHKRVCLLPLHDPFVSSTTAAPNLWATGQHPDMGHLALGYTQRMYSLHFIDLILNNVLFRKNYQIVSPASRLSHMYICDLLKGAALIRNKTHETTKLAKLPKTNVFGQFLSAEWKSEETDEECLHFKKRKLNLMEKNRSPTEIWIYSKSLLLTHRKPALHNMLGLALKVYNSFYYYI